MAWQTIDRKKPLFEAEGPPLLSEAVREKIRAFFPRYETKRAVLLPALHIVQDALGHVPWRAMVEVAEVLDIHPSDVFDTISFYTHFWTEPKGKKVITVCRSISCEVMGGAAVLEEIKSRLGIAEHETTADKRYSLITEECVAGCDHAPCLLINERMHKRVAANDVARILADEDNDRIESPRSDIFDAPSPTDASAPLPAGNGAEPLEAILESTSDVREMKES